MVNVFRSMAGSVSVGNYSDELSFHSDQPPGRPGGVDWLGWFQAVLAGFALAVGFGWRSPAFIWVSAALLFLLVGRALAWPLVVRIYRRSASARAARRRLRLARAQSAEIERQIAALGILMRTGNDTRALQSVLGSLGSLRVEERLQRASDACALFNDLWVLISRIHWRAPSLREFGDRVRLLDFAVVQFTRACAEPIFDPGRGAPRLPADDRNRLLGWREQFMTFLGEYGRFREGLAELEGSGVVDRVFLPSLPFPPEQGVQAAPQASA